METNYQKQALDFLSNTNTTLKIELSKEQKKPLWAKDNKHGLHYVCTLENKNAKYTFDFWDSIHNKEMIEAIDTIKGYSIGNDIDRFRASKLLENNKIDWLPLRFQNEAREKAKAEYTPKEYDVLACLLPLYDDTLEDFCMSFGYDSDSITALKTFEACKEQDRNLRKLWDRSELEQLANIQ